MIYVIYQNKINPGAFKMLNSSVRKLGDKAFFVGDVDNKVINGINGSDTVIFVYNEDMLSVWKGFKKDISKLKDVERRISKRCDRIYNRPSKYKLYGCKYAFLKRITKNRKMGRDYIPKYKL